MRRGNRYGTILVDLERRRPIDLLPNREAATLEQWLRAHPGVKIVARDRSATYAEGIRKGVPAAIQVIDRWHLLGNLREAVERVLSNRQPQIREAASVVIKSLMSSAPAIINAGPTTMLSSRNGQAGRQSRERRYSRYREVIRLHQQGLSMRRIAEELGMSRVTVRHYIEADGFPERAPTKTRRSELEKYVPYLHQRFAAGCENATQLWREIVARGYRGRVRMVRRYVWRLRARTKALSLKQQLEIQSTAVRFRTPSSRRAAWWLIRRADELSADERLFVKQLTDLCPEIEKVKELAQVSERW